MVSALGGWNNWKTTSPWVLSQILFRGIKNTKPKRGLGLVGLRERVESLGGSFSVMPGRGGKGTCVSAQIPIK